MSKDEKVNYWIDLSDYDLETARAMLKTKRFLYVGFMCHQSIEKLLKAVFAQVNGQQPPRIHNLIRLSEKGQVYNDLTEQQRDFLMYLNPMNIEGRYPTYKEEVMKILDERVCENILFQTEEFANWIKNRLSV